MAIAVQMDYTVDLCEPARLIQMDVPFFTGDRNAHRFHVKLVRAACAIDVTGISAKGYMVRADKQTVIWDGEVDGCDIYLTMPAACYAVAGRFRLLLRVMLEDTIETALWVEGSVRDSGTAAIVDPDDTLPNLNELIDQINMIDEIRNELDRLSDDVSELKENGVGTPGGDGVGTPGEDGVGIESVTQTTTSTDDGGINVITVTMTDGSVSTFTIKNGSKGSPGSKGDDGKSATVKIGTVTTLPAGSNATVTNTGTDSDAVFNFGIPRGSDGAGGSGSGEAVAPGEDGGYYTPSVTDGVLSWTPSKSDMVAVPSANIRGNNGKTPVKGTDYWTAADRKSMVDDVIAALPVYGGEVAEA